MIAVDTNVLIYSLDRHEPAKLARARELLRELRAHREDVLLPWQVAGEFLRFLRSLEDSQKLSRAALERTFRAYLGLFPLAMPTPEVLGHALELSERFSLSHWDSMLLGACCVAGVTLLYTEDMGAPVVFDGIRRVNPFA